MAAGSVAPSSGSGGKAFTLSTEGQSIENILGAGSGIAIAAYLIAVVMNGNTNQLGSLLVQEEPYLEFVVAILAIWALAKWGPTGPITDSLVIGAVVALALKVGANVNFGSTLQQFASGQKGILATGQALIGQIFPNQQTKVA